MNNKYYVGKNAQNFEQYDDVTISGVELKGTDGATYTAGDQTGYVLPVNCTYATQQMADELFRLLGRKVYRGYRATNTTLDPLAELGDGVTVDGVYSLLAYRRVNFGPEHMSEIAAPGDSTLNHEYTYIGQTQKELDKQADETQKKLEEFAQRVNEYIEEIQQQTDAKAETWYQEEDPATGWDDAEKKEHSGDLWYKPSTRDFYVYDGEKWNAPKSEIPEYVFDEIDQKAQIFVNRPEPPYNENDLWFSGTSDPIRVCVQSRPDGDTFHDEDWEKRDEYIDKAEADDSAQQAVDGQTQEAIFNKLTNGGQDQGIFLKDGKLYINAEYLRGDTIDLTLLRLTGTLCGLMQGKGKTGQGDTTTGIVMYGNSRNNDGTARPPYIIVTNAGVRAQITNEQAVYFSDGYANFSWLNITCSNNILAEGIFAIGPYGGHEAIEYDNSTSLMSFGAKEAIGYFPRTYLRGGFVYVNEDASDKSTYLRGGDIYASRNIEVSSDERLKKDIHPLPEQYLRVLDNMKPVLYRYRREDDDAPPHIGYVAQNLQSALSAAGMSKADMAALGAYQTEEGEERLAIAYEELIALLHLKIKSLEDEINKIKEEIKR